MYHEDEDGTVHYDFTILDQTYDAIVEAGHHVLVEIGFTPRDLLPPEAAELTVPSSPTGGEAPEKQSPSAHKMLFEVRSMLRVMVQFPQYRTLPAIIDECDAGVPAHFSFYDNANFRFQNTEYYPVFQVNLMKKLLDLSDAEGANIQQATSWSFYFEGERFFEGTRAFLTADRIEKPLLNAYRLLAHLGAQRLTHHRIDSGHSNSHTVWQALGSPQVPSPEQLAQIHAREGLEELEPPRRVEVGADGVLALTVELPLPAVSLLVMERVG